MKFFRFFIFYLFLSFSLFSNEIITPELLELLDVTSISHDSSVGSIVDQTQEKWLRKKGKERWQIIDQIDPSQRNRVIELCAKMGFLEVRYPQKSCYEYCVVLGATAPCMKFRLQDAYDLWQRGVHFSKLVFLLGERPLSPEVESFEMEMGLNTEVEAARWIYENADLALEFRKIPVEFVSAPMKRIQEVWFRPNTVDTVDAWMATYPSSGSCLCISNQPYILYQQEAILSVIPEDFEIEVVGRKVFNQTLKISNLLDTVARWIYIKSKQSIR